ncbi:MAG TPA: hypothetical protein DD473_11810 [Planctomycetaceae bacterium]|nr:hypothetical protein [Planctomycetaceae bacterium]
MALKKNLMTDKSGKTAGARVNRIPPDYYRRSDSIRKWRHFLLAISVLLVGAITLLSVDWSGVRSNGLQGSTLVKWATNHGEISQAHAAWENQCEVCHEPFNPIRDQHAGSFFNSFAGTQFKTEARCTSCHQESLGHVCQHSIIDQQGCASCHHEHRGRNHNITDVRNKNCTKCHQDLEKAMAGIEPNASCSKMPHANGWQSIEHFSTESHPQFVSLEDGDPGNIKFNHRLHLAYGQGLGEKGGEILAEIDPELPEERLKQLADSKQLKCSDCHERAGLDSAGDGATQRMDFRPINYERHCGSCHPMRSAVTLVEQSYEISNAARDLYEQDRTQLIEERIPHGLSLEQLEFQIRQRLAGLSVYGQKELTHRTDHSSVKMPGKSEAQPLPDLIQQNLNRDAEQTKAHEVKEDSLETLRYLSQKAVEQLTGLGANCTKCHYYTATLEDGQKKQVLSFEEAMSLSQIDSMPGNGPIEISPSNIPQHWFKKAKFHHHAHRMVSCESCHPGVELQDSHATYAELVDTPATFDNHVVMIPGMDVCVKCHSNSPEQRKASGNRAKMGASDACVLCHSFHQADQFHQQYESEFSNHFRTIEEFLNFKGPSD